MKTNYDLAWNQPLKTVGKKDHQSICRTACVPHFIQIDFSLGERLRTIENFTNVNLNKAIRPNCGLVYSYND